MSELICVIYHRIYGDQLDSIPEVDLLMSSAPNGTGNKEWSTVAIAGGLTDALRLRRKTVITYRAKLCAADGHFLKMPNRDNGPDEDGRGSRDLGCLVDDDRAYLPVTLMPVSDCGMDTMAVVICDIIKLAVDAVREAVQRCGGEDLFRSVGVSGLLVPTVLRCDDHKAIPSAIEMADSHCSGGFVRPFSLHVKCPTHRGNFSYLSRVDGVNGRLSFTSKYFAAAGTLLDAQDRLGKWIRATARVTSTITEDMRDNLKATLDHLKAVGVDKRGGMGQGSKKKQGIAGIVKEFAETFGMGGIFDSGEVLLYSENPADADLAIRNAVRVATQCIQYRETCAHHFLGPAGVAQFVATRAPLLLPALQFDVDDDEWRKFLEEDEREEAEDGSDSVKMSADERISRQFPQINKTGKVARMLMDPVAMSEIVAIAILPEDALCATLVCNLGDLVDGLPQLQKLEAWKNRIEEDGGLQMSHILRRVMRFAALSDIDNATRRVMKGLRARVGQLLFRLRWQYQWRFPMLRRGLAWDDMTDADTLRIVGLLKSEIDRADFMDLVLILRKTSASNGPSECMRAELQCGQKTHPKGCATLAMIDILLKHRRRWKYRASRAGVCKGEWKKKEKIPREENRLKFLKKHPKSREWRGGDGESSGSSDDGGEDDDKGSDFAESDNEDWGWTCSGGDPRGKDDQSGPIAIESITFPERYTHTGDCGRVRLDGDSVERDARNALGVLEKELAESDEHMCDFWDEEPESVPVNLVGVCREMLDIFAKNPSPVRWCMPGKWPAWAKLHSLWNMHDSALFQTHASHMGGGSQKRKYRHRMSRQEAMDLVNLGAGGVRGFISAMPIPKISDGGQDADRSSGRRSSISSSDSGDMSSLNGSELLYQGFEKKTGKHCKRSEGSCGLMGMVLKNA